MRVYLGITGTGGQIRGSYEVGNVYKSAIAPKTLFNSVWGNYKCLDAEKMDWRYQGYTNQKYAFEIKGFREESLSANGVHQDPNCPIWMIGYDSLKPIKRLPQGFCYVIDPFGTSLCDKAVLMPIHQKWFDMIESGEKKYEFRNVLPRAMKGE